MLRGEGGLIVTLYYEGGVMNVLEVGFVNESIL